MSDARPPKMGFEHASEQAQTRLGDLLWDAHAAGSKLLEFTAGRSFEEFSESEPLRAAAQAMLTIMAQSLTAISREFPAEFAKLDADTSNIREFIPASDSSLWTAVQSAPEVVADVQTLLDQWHQG